MKTLFEQWEDSLYKNEDLWKNYQEKEKHSTSKTSTNKLKKFYKLIKIKKYKSQNK